MANETSLTFQDVLLNTAAMEFENDEYSLFPPDFAIMERLLDWDRSMSPFYFEEAETRSNDEFFSNAGFNDLPDTSLLSSPLSQQDVIDIDALFLDAQSENSLSLSFINPPDSYYHVRYISEITDSPLDGSGITTRTKTKRNLSGRYLKGLRGRYVTITLPQEFSNVSSLYIRVTRLTVPYQDTSFVHPYPLYYSSKKNNKYPSHVISHGVSIYFKITHEELRFCSKQFSNIILTRLKQCELNKMNSLYPFDNSSLSHPFIGTNAKNRIARYRLKQSLIDFRLVIRCEQTCEFLDTGVFCRSTALLEAEGTNWKR